MSTPETTIGTFLQHYAKANDKGTMIDHFLFQIPTGIADITIASEKYWKFIGENEDFLTPNAPLLEQKLIANNTAGGTKLYVLKDGFSLTESMYLKGETQLALNTQGQPNTLGAQGVTIKSIEVDDQTIILTLSDGAVGKRGFTTKVQIPQPDGKMKDEYFADVAKKARFFQRELGQNVTPTTVGTFDVNTLIGATIDYKVQMSNFSTPPKPWLEFSNLSLTPAPSTPVVTPEQLEAMLNGGQA